jgi:hypothetical protein
MASQCFTLPIGEVSRCAAARRCQRLDAVAFQRSAHGGALRFAADGRVEIDKPRTGRRWRRRVRYGDGFGLRAFGGALAQFAQPPGQPGSQAC